MRAETKTHALKFCVNAIYEAEDVCTQALKTLDPNSAEGRPFANLQSALEDMMTLIIEANAAKPSPLKQTAFMAYTTATERRITRALINGAIQRGWTVSAHDGDQWTVKNATAVATVTDKLATTGSDRLHFTNADQRGVGQIILIWGNDEDVISDHSDNEAINALVAEAQQ